ncbi:MAG: DUF423 domain-containing protein [Parachlamydiaceae bacterium]
MLHFPQQLLLGSATLMGFLAVALGAFAAHALKQRLEHDMFAIYEVGVRYQTYHVLAMALAVWISTVTPGPWALWAGWVFFGGILIFSGSLYALALSGIRTFGAITPIGGLLLLLGWILLTIAAFKR